ncbi:MAG: lysozyme inhibitor LprI family protein [Lachnospiraceae bacterium]|nr:lysozyme inhibitor LprI family protein [Lachnospiraceae bacterium]
MKKKIILTTVFLTITLLSACQKSDNSQIQKSTNEKLSNEQTEKNSDSEEQSKEVGTDLENLEESKESIPSETQTAQLSQADNTESDFSLDSLSDRVFYFSSGAGGWSTDLFINSDGTFRGNYHDSDMGDTGENYPNGTLYFCEFTGRFDGPEKIDEYTYKLSLASIEYKHEPEKEEIIDGVRNIYSTAYGLDDGEEFYLYLPGTKLAELPEEYLMWVGYYNLENTTETELPYYGLYNVNMEQGFSSYVYEEQSLLERIEMEISFAEESDTELNVKLQEAATQLDMNMIGEEIFQTWDTVLNVVWKLLEAELDDTAMETLRTEEREWIAIKDAEVEAAGAGCEGGSMQPFIETMKAAELTKERVYELEKYAE